MVKIFTGMRRLFCNPIVGLDSAVRSAPSVVHHLLAVPDHLIAKVTGGASPLTYLRGAATRRGLMTILSEERSVFSVFNQSKRLSTDAIAFASPGAQSFKHWNVVYPLRHGHRFTRSELEQAKGFFGVHGVHGHVMTPNTGWGEHSVESAEYFVMDGTGSFLSENGIRFVEFTSPDDPRYRAFCEIATKGFGMDPPTSAYFFERIAALGRAVRSRFCIAYYGDEACGVASTFQTAGRGEFLFNVAVAQGTRRQGIGTALVSYFARTARRPLYAYSDNFIMQDRILPAAGFRSTGTMHIVPIDQYLRFA